MEHDRGNADNRSSQGDLTPPTIPNHYIKAVSGNRVPSAIMIMDTETKTTRLGPSGTTYEQFHVAACLYAERRKMDYYEEERAAFTDGIALWDWIALHLRRDRPLWLFGHNIGFDLINSGFFDRVDSGEYSTSDLWGYGADEDARGGKRKRKWRGSIITTDPPTIIILRHERGTIRIVDTFNYCKTTLAEIGESVGIKKTEDPGKDADESDRIAYCMNDVLILFYAVRRWLNEWNRIGHGNWQSTGPSLAWQSWRHLSGGRSVVTDHSEEQLYYARAAWYNGANIIFYHGDVYPDVDITIDRHGGLPVDYFERARGPVYEYDIRAMYLHIMATCPMPCRFAEVTRENTIADVLERGLIQLPIAVAYLDSPDRCYPVRNSKGYFHATGQFTTVLAWPELRFAIEHGDCVGLGTVVWYDADMTTQRFGEYWLRKRDECKQRGDKAGELFYKLVGNGLAGKFNQRRAVWKDTPEFRAVHRFGEWQERVSGSSSLIRRRAIAGNVQTHVGSGELQDTFPAISAFINSYGRANMQAARELCPPETCLYQDTDGLFLLERGQSALLEAGLIRPGEAGFFQECGVHDWATFHGLKYYVTSAGVTCAGLKKDAEPKEPGIWVQDYFQRLPDALANYVGPLVKVAGDTFRPTGTLGYRVATARGWTVAPRLCEPWAVPF